MTQAAIAGRKSWLPAWAMNGGIVFLIAGLWPIHVLLSRYIQDYVVLILTEAALNVVLATSLSLINGMTGQFSLGHAAFMGIGAYAAGAFLKHEVHADVTPVYLGLFALFLGGTMSAIAGLLIGIPTLRLRGDYLAIATLGFNQIVYTIIINTNHVGPFQVGGASGLHNVPAFGNFFWAAASAIVCVITVWRMVHSAKGRGFFAVREDEIAAAAMGVNVTYFKVTAFTVGAFFAGVAGALFGTLTQNLDPDSYTFLRSFDFVVMVVLGGSGTVSGVVMAALLLTGLSEGLRDLKQFTGNQDLRPIVYALLLIVMMLLRPEGILGNRELLRPRKRRPQIVPGLNIVPKAGG